MIAGKTHSEILAMPSSTRSWWYKRILPEERTEAMSIVKAEARQKRSVSQRRRWQDPEFRIRMSEASRRNWQDPNYRERVSKGGWWTPEEKEILRRHYPTSTAKHLMELLPNRTEKAIYTKYYRLGHIRRGWVSEEEKDYVAAHFYARGVRGIAEDLGIDWKRVQRIANSMGLYVRASHGHRPPDSTGRIDLSSLDEYGIKYLAGILDTKGLMAVYSTGKSYQVRVGVNTTDPKLAEWLGRLGGSSRWFSTSVWRSACQWTIANRVGARILIEAVLEYLKLNRANAEAILLWLNGEIDSEAVVSMTTAARTRVRLTSAFNA